MGSLAGKVVGVDAKPLQGASVAIISSSDKKQRIVVTDEYGRYRITELVPSSYTVRAWKLGYVAAEFGQRDPTDLGKSIEVSNGKPVDGIDITLARAGVITVRVINSAGTPLAGATVQPLAMRFVNGQRRLAAVGSEESLFPFTTDDRGETRVFGLSAGEYYLTARAFEHGPFDLRRPVSPVFYPGTSSQELAQTVSLGSGDEVFAVIPVMATSRGTLTANITSQEPLVQVNSQMLGIQPSGFFGFPLRSQSERGFVAQDLPPGNYVVQIRARNSSGEDEYANTAVTFTGEDATVSIVTRPGATVVGRFVFESQTLRQTAKPGEIQVAPIFVGSTVATGKVEVRDDWTFQIRGIAGTGFLDIRQPANGWFLQKVTLDGEDVTDKPLDFQTAFAVRPVEIYVTQRRTVLSGDVTDSKGARASDYVVVVFSADASRWTPRSRYVATARGDRAGRYQIVGLPAGSYLIAALDRLERGREYDVQTLESLRKLAKPLRLADGESRQETLRMMSYR